MIGFFLEQVVALMQGKIDEAVGDDDETAGDDILEQVVALRLREGDRSEHSRSGNKNGGN